MFYTPWKRKQNRTKDLSRFEYLSGKATDQTPLKSVSGECSYFILPEIQMFTSVFKRYEIGIPSAEGLFKCVWPFSGLQLSEGEVFICNSFLSDVIERYSLNAYIHQCVKYNVCSNFPWAASNMHLTKHYSE